MKIGIRLLLCAMLAAAPLRALAGPPFDIDGPTSSSDLPFLEVNYGLMPNVQFSVHIGNVEQTSAGTAPAYGYEDSQVGVKVRFIRESVGRFAIFGGGGGYDFDRDASGAADWQAGLATTYPLDADDTIGMELTRTTPHDDYQQSDVGFGYIRSIGATHALLFSIGWFLGPKGSDRP